MDLLARSKAILADLVAFPSVSSGGNLKITQYIADLLEDAGAHVEIMPSPCGTKANLFATFGPRNTDGGIVLSGHSDVVPVADQEWLTDPFAMTEADGRLFGRGTCDMKGFLAACLALAPRFADVSHKIPVHYAVTYDEEVGCFGAQHLAEVLAERGVTPKIALVGEPTEMRIIDGHKGCYEYTTQFTGLAGHGSQPDLGVNAAEYAARYAVKLMELKEVLKTRAPEDSLFDPPWTTINIGHLSGGTATNVIPATAKVDWEMRPVQLKDAAFVKDTLTAFCEDTLLPEMRAVYPGATIETEIVAEITGLTPKIENTARQVIAKLTGANTTEVVAFGTEAGIFDSIGMDVVVCGPGSIEQAHKADEFLSMDQLAQCITLLEKLSDHLEAGTG